MSVSVNIKGLQKAQRANLKAIRAMQPRGALGKAVVAGVAMGHRYSVIHTPHDTGSLRASHRMKVNRGQTVGRVFLDPRAKNPRSRVRPAEYGYYLHRHGLIPGIRSGWRAFYEYVAKTYGNSILKRMTDIIKKGLP